MATATTPPAAPPPEKKGNLLWWLLGLLLAGVAILGIGGVLVASFVLRNVEVRKSGNEVQIQTPAGGIKVTKDAPADPGLPVYPGAATSETGAIIEISGPDEEPFTVTAARYRTTDPLPKVDAWYQERLGAEFQREGPGVMRRKKDIFGVTVKSSDIAYIAEEKDHLRVVALERKGIYTEVALARIGKQEAQ